MGIKVRTQNTAMGFIYSKPFVAELAFTADVAAADAQALPIIVPEMKPGIAWPMWQVRTRFSAGSTLSGNLYIYVRDTNTQQWHALSLIELMDDDAVTADTGQVVQFEAPAGCDMLAIGIDITSADDRPHVTIRGVAYTDVAS